MGASYLNIIIIIIIIIIIRNVLPLYSQDKIHKSLR